MLDIMEAFVQDKGYTYVRMDGGTSISARQPLVQKYNNVRLFYLFVLHSVLHFLVHVFINLVTYQGNN